MRQPTDSRVGDPQPPQRRGKSLKRSCEDVLQELIAAQPPSPAQRSAHTRPADPAYPSGWLDPLGNFYPCRVFADEHERLAAGLARYVSPSSAEPGRQVLEQAGWRALHHNGTITPEAVTLQQAIFLTALVVDRGGELEERYRVGLIHSLCRLAGTPLVSEAPLPERLPLPKLLSVDEALTASPYLTGWLDPGGKLYVCSHQMHGRFASVLAHALGITAPSALDPWCRLERAGWAHVMGGGLVSHPPRGFSQAQLDTLGDVLADERLSADYRTWLRLSLDPDVEQRR